MPGYQVIQVTTFSGRIPTACGIVTSEVGPFSSSGDASVYLDLGFFDELQADCYVGVWFNHATNDPGSPISEVTRSDVDDALGAAAAVGDDRIQ